MTEERHKARKLGRVFASQSAGKEHSDCCFAAIQQKREQRGGLVACAQDIGCADIARTDGAQISEVHHARDQDAEGHRAEEIADEGPEGENEGGVFDEGHQPKTFLPAT